MPAVNLGKESENNFIKWQGMTEPKPLIRVRQVEQEAAGKPRTLCNQFSEWISTVWRNLLSFFGFASLSKEDTDSVNEDGLAQDEGNYPATEEQSRGEEPKLFQFDPRDAGAEDGVPLPAIFREDDMEDEGSVGDNQKERKGRREVQYNLIDYYTVLSSGKTLPQEGLQIQNNDEVGLSFLFEEDGNQEAESSGFHAELDIATKILDEGKLKEAKVTEHEGEPICDAHEIYSDEEEFYDAKEDWSDEEAPTVLQQEKIGGINVLDEQQTQATDLKYQKIDASAIVAANELALMNRGNLRACYQDTKNDGVQQLNGFRVKSLEGMTMPNCLQVTLRMVQNGHVNEVHLSANLEKCAPFWVLLENVRDVWESMQEITRPAMSGYCAMKARGELNPLKAIEGPVMPAKENDSRPSFFDRIGIPTHLGAAGPNNKETVAIILPDMPQKQTTVNDSQACSASSVENATKPDNERSVDIIKSFTDTVQVETNQEVLSVEKPDADQVKQRRLVDFEILKNLFQNELRKSGRDFVQNFGASLIATSFEGIEGKIDNLANFPRKIPDDFSVLLRDHADVFANEERDVFKQALAEFIQMVNRLKLLSGDNYQEDTKSCKGKQLPAFIQDKLFKGFAIWEKSNKKKVEMLYYFTSNYGNFMPFYQFQECLFAEYQKCFDPGNMYGQGISLPVITLEPSTAQEETQPKEKQIKQGWFNRVKGAAANVSRSVAKAATTMLAKKQLVRAFDPTNSFKNLSELNSEFEARVDELEAGWFPEASVLRKQYVTACLEEKSTDEQQKLLARFQKQRVENTNENDRMMMDVLRGMAVSNTFMVGLAHLLDLAVALKPADYEPDQKRTCVTQ